MDLVVDYCCVDLGEYRWEDVDLVPMRVGCEAVDYTVNFYIAFTEVDEGGSYDSLFLWAAGGEDFCFGGVDQDDVRLWLEYFHNLFLLV